MTHARSLCYSSSFFAPWSRLAKSTNVSTCFFVDPRALRRSAISFDSFIASGEVGALLKTIPSMIFDPMIAYISRRNSCPTLNMSIGLRFSNLPSFMRWIIAFSASRPLVTASNKSRNWPSLRIPRWHSLLIASPRDFRRFRNIHSSIASSSDGDIIVTTR